MISVDRIENGIIIAECDGKSIEISKDKIEGNVKEGDILIKTENGYKVSVSDTENRKKIIAEKEASLFGE